MTPVQFKQHKLLLKSAGYRDAPALTLDSHNGHMPHGREISLSWLSGTILTGVTGVLLMASALYVSFDGRGTFATPYSALSTNIVEGPTSSETDSRLVTKKSDRVRPVAATRSDREIIEASIRETVDGVDRIRRQPFVRINATLATSATALSSDIPNYDPIALLRKNQPIALAEDARTINTDIYGAEVEGEVTVKEASLNIDQAPPPAIDDQLAADYVRTTVEGAFSGTDSAALAYAPENVPGLRELSVASDGFTSVAQNVSVVPKAPASANETARTERIISVRQTSPIGDVLAKNGFTEQMVSAIERTMRSVNPSTEVREGFRMRILFGLDAGTETQIPYLLSLYNGDERHLVTVARTDQGRYVLGAPPPGIELPEEDTEEINVANLPSLYRSIYETGRKLDLKDKTIERIVAMFAYDLDLTKRISPGDQIQMLQTEPDADGNKELLYIGLQLAGTERHMYRFQTEDGVVDFFDENGQTGKKFLMRRPLEGGGRLRSNYGYRIHPIFKTRKLHTGVDLAARTGTPVYAGGDGVVKRAQWVSGYGRFVELNHANGYQTAYAHMNRIASGMQPGTRVRQGQIIGYVGSTGYSTGPHLHYEIKINGRTVDPLSVRLPRDKSLPNRYRAKFDQTMAQIDDLMAREPSAPINVADAGN
ncbi:M23 family metallopeptidase [Maritalea myrionectae]|uniref:M23 family metallopeptidase n=1 Tax=Maritalea myrionectae TaxID=454601 RepID=UPI00041DA599|nr:M23 family metallopeptidase [Maritalea myrionectae]